MALEFPERPDHHESVPHQDIPKAPEGIKTALKQESIIEKRIERLLLGLDIDPKFKAKILNAYQKDQDFARGIQQIANRNGYPFQRQNDVVDLYLKFYPKGVTREKYLLVQLKSDLYEKIINGKRSGSLNIDQIMNEISRLHGKKLDGFAKLRFRDKTHEDLWVADMKAYIDSRNSRYTIIPHVMFTKKDMAGEIRLENMELRSEVSQAIEDRYDQLKSKAKKEDG